ncbi:MAG: hypothetical protein A2Z20_00420 [Bdellovibrionales bacterium RBG_16_40_8]|nr:MAG: hypothetical protein A2Z20_00420 [Bdellovibrionales bacterium RBG_16_40_8]
MNIRALSDSELEFCLRSKVSEERKITVEVIRLLEEVNSRNLHLERGYGSLIEYCIRDLGYSESSAYRRVAAMRVAKEIPQVTEALTEGRLSLVVVAQAHTFFKKTAKSKTELGEDKKCEVFKALEQKSAREAEKILLHLLPDLAANEIPKEKIKAVTAEYTQVTMVLHEKLRLKLEELKSLFSHKNSNPSYSELVELLADFALKKLKPEPARIGVETIIESNVKLKTQRNTNAGAALRHNISADAEISVDGCGVRKHISKSLRVEVWRRADHRCTYTDLITGRRCESKFQLQVEHIVPVAKGGTNDLQNLELLCAAHNKLRAIQTFGRSHMQQFTC